MANESVMLNRNVAPFVEDEAPAESGETDITPGHFLERKSDGDVGKKSGEIAVGTDAPGRGMVAILSRSDPTLTKSDAYNQDDDQEQVHYAHVPIGGEVDAFVESGGDLSSSSDANITEGDELVEGPTGGLMKSPGQDTTGDGTGSATETVHPVGALYEAQESVDNSGASAGVSNQKRIEVKRIA